MRRASMVAGALAFLVGSSTSAASAPEKLSPIALHGGVNPVRDIAGDGRTGSITLDWVENGNAWGYSIFSVRVGGSLAAVDGVDRFVDRPHTGEDAITVVRFARGPYGGRVTTFAIVAERAIAGSVPDPAPTTIRLYALARNPEPIGTPYRFALVRQIAPMRAYCSADMALASELGMAPRRSYSGPRTPDGC